MGSSCALNITGPILIAFGVTWGLKGFGDLGFGFAPERCEFVALWGNPQIE